MDDQTPHIIRFKKAVSIGDLLLQQDSSADGGAPADKKLTTLAKKVKKEDKQIAREKKAKEKAEAQRAEHRESLADEMVQEEFPGTTENPTSQPTAPPVVISPDSEEVFDQHQKELNEVRELPDPNDMFVNPPKRIDKDEELDEDIDELDKKVGGRPNFTRLARFMDPAKGTADLLDKRSSAISDEVRSTDFTVGQPAVKGKAVEWDPRGFGINSMSYGIPLPYVPEFIAKMVNSDKKPYSRGYQESYATALLAAMGLGGEAYPGLNISALPEVNMYRNQRIGSEGPTGEDAFKQWFNAAMSAQGRDPEEARARFQVPLKRAMLISQMMAAGDNEGLETIKSLTKARRQAWKDGDAEGEAKATEALNKFYDEYDGSNLPERADPATVMQILSDAMNGQALGGNAELGTALKWLVNEDLRASEPGAPVSIKDLDKTRANYEEIYRVLSDPAIQSKYLPEMIMDKAATIKRKYGDASGSTSVNAAINGLTALADKVRNKEELTPRDMLYLSRWGISATPKGLLAHLLGSQESADNFWNILQYDLPEEERSIRDYLTVPDVGGLDDPVRSEKGLYLRHFINSLAGDLQDSLAGNNTVNNALRNEPVSMWDALRYAIHRGGKDSLGKKRTDQYSDEDRAKLAKLDRDSGKWSWKDEDIRNMMRRLKTEAPSAEDLDLLRKMGFLKKDTTFQDRSADYINALFSANGVPFQVNDSQASDPNSYARTLTSLFELKDLADSGAISLDPAQVKMIDDYITGSQQFYDESGKMKKGIPSSVTTPFSNMKNKLAKLVSTYNDVPSIDEIAMKTFPGDYQVVPVSLDGNLGDIKRYILPNENAMTRPQTYATALRNYDDASSLMNAISDKEDRLKSIPYDITRAENNPRLGEAAVSRLEAERYELEKELPELRSSFKKLRSKLPYATSAISMDQNAGNVDEEKLTARSARKYAEDLAEQEELEENDQFLASVDKLLSILSKGGVDYTADEWDDMVESLLYEGTDPMELARYTYPDVFPAESKDITLGTDPTIEHNLPELLAMRNFIYDYVNGQGAKVANDDLSQREVIRRKKTYRIPKWAKVPYVAVKEPTKGHPDGGGHGWDQRRPDLGVTLTELMNPRHIYDNNGMGVSLPNGVEDREITEYVTKTPSAASTLSALYGDNLENVPELEPWLSLPNSDEFMNALRDRKYFPWISDSYKNLNYLSEEEEDKQKELVRHNIINLAKAMLKRAPKLSREEYNSVFKSMSVLPILRRKKLKDA